MVKEFLEFLKSNFFEDQYTFFVSKDSSCADITIKSKNSQQIFTISILPEIIGIGLLDTNVLFDFTTFEYQFDNSNEAFIFLFEHPLSLLKNESID